MAFQRSIFNLSGKIGNVIHYRRDEKNLVRGKSENYQLSAESRKTGNEFGNCSKAGRMIRKGFEPILKRVADDKFISRLTAILVKVNRTGPVAKKGRRMVTDGNTALLKGLELNRHCNLDRRLHRMPITRLNSPGVVVIDFPGFVPGDVISAPAGASEVVMEFVFCSFDFAGEKWEQILTDDLVIPLNGESFEDVHFEIPVDTKGKKLVMVCMDIYFRDSYGNMKRNRLYRAGKVMEVALFKNKKLVTFKAAKVVKVAEKVVEVERVAWKKGLWKG